MCWFTCNWINCCTQHLVFNKYEFWSKVEFLLNYFLRRSSQVPSEISLRFIIIAWPRPGLFAPEFFFSYQNFNRLNNCLLWKFIHFWYCRSYLLNNFIFRIHRRRHSSSEKKPLINIYVTRFLWWIAYNNMRQAQPAWRTKS